MTGNQTNPVFSTFAGADLWVFRPITEVKFLTFLPTVIILQATLQSWVLLGTVCEIFPNRRWSSSAVDESKRLQIQQLALPNVLAVNVRTLTV